MRHCAETSRVDRRSCKSRGLAPEPAGQWQSWKKWRRRQPLESAGNGCSYHAARCKVRVWVSCTGVCIGMHPNGLSSQGCILRASCGFCCWIQSYDWDKYRQASQPQMVVIWWERVGGHLMGTCNLVILQVEDWRIQLMWWHNNAIHTMIVLAHSIPRLVQAAREPRRWMGRIAAGFQTARERRLDIEHASTNAEVLTARTDMSDEFSLLRRKSSESLSADQNEFAEKVNIVAWSYRFTLIQAFAHTLAL